MPIDVPFATRRPVALRGAVAPTPDTIAALATPRGTSALALVRVSGPRASALAREVFGTEAPARMAKVADYRNLRGELIDEVVYTRYAAPHSYTGEDALEISSHGNPYLVLRLLEDLHARGCRPAEPGEFTRRAFLNGRMDLSQAEAVMDLIHARSERAVAAAHRQLRGSLSHRMGKLIAQALHCQALVEAYIDFPDEDLPEQDRNQLLQNVTLLSADTSRLLATSHYGEMLRSGIKTVILGQPNAGKSSLLNALIGHDRALVSPEPGTTRDYLEEALIIGPYSLRLIDTAGLNHRPGALEERGIAKALEQAEAADLYLWVIDTTVLPYPLPDSILERMTTENTIVVFNKSDLSGVRQVIPKKEIRTVSISATLGTGLEELRQEIIRLADLSAQSTGEEEIAISARHAHALGLAQEALDAAIAKLKTGPADELLASDLRQVIEAYGQISGRIDNERMLDQLFSSFCIGK